MHAVAHSSAAQEPAAGEAATDVRRRRLRQGQYGQEAVRSGVASARPESYGSPGSARLRIKPKELVRVLPLGRPQVNGHPKGCRLRSQSWPAPENCSLLARLSHRVISNRGPLDPGFVFGSLSDCHR